VAVQEKLITAQELWQMPEDGCRRELIRGKLQTMPPVSFEHGDVTSEIDASLRSYVRAHQLGRVVVGNVGFLLAEDPDTVRAPDVGFVRRERLKEIGRRSSFWPGAPDLAVEVVSPTDLYTEVDEKVADWLESGARMVFVVNPRRRSVALHRAGQAVRILTGKDSLDGDDVVPGWSLPVADLFSDS
jgi:Uma2 family endonuclease